MAHGRPSDELIVRSRVTRTLVHSHDERCRTRRELKRRLTRTTVSKVHPPRSAFHDILYAGGLRRLVRGECRYRPWSSKLVARNILAKTRPKAKCRNQRQSRAR